MLVKVGVLVAVDVLVSVSGRVGVMVELCDEC